MIAKQYCITKYDKAKRDENGTYWDMDQWTEVRDIGRTIMGKKVRFRHYARVEAKYIEAVLALFDACGLPHLRLTCVKFDSEVVEWRRRRTPQHYQRAFADIDFREDAVITRDLIPVVIRMLLREIASAKLEFLDHFFVHFGYDFYMYVGTSCDRPDIVAQIEADGLFVEDYPSPFHLQPGTDFVPRITRSDAGEGYMDELNIALPPGSVEALRDIWGYSNEHPFCGYWKIRQEHLPELKNFTDHAFDMPNFDYWLECDIE